MELQAGDLVVVPAMGVGRVVALEDVEVGDDLFRGFRIDMGSDDGLFWVPEDRVDDEGLRAPMDEQTAATVITLIAEAEAPKKRANWNRRQKRYREMMVSNEPDALAKLVGELAAVRAKKRTKKQTLSFSEKRIFQRAFDLLVDELVAATGRARDACQARLQAAVSA